MPQNRKDLPASNETVARAKGVGHIPSGLFIVCARDPNTHTLDGYLASWIQQVSFDPLLVSLAAKGERPSYKLIAQGNIFTINILGEHDRSYEKLFSTGYDPTKNPFKNLPTKEGQFGGVILKAAKSTMECTLHSHLEPGDHQLIIARVLASHIQNERAKPLVHIRETGLNY
jgi:flavin reductase (DIM6/NTAB) family NADH-FMN oxidoreductase RutF